MKLLLDDVKDFLPLAGRATVAAEHHQGDDRAARGLESVMDNCYR